MRIWVSCVLLSTSLVSSAQASDPSLEDGGPQQWTTVSLFGDEGHKGPGTPNKGTPSYQNPEKPLFTHTSSEEEDAASEEAVATQRCKCKRSACCWGTAIGSTLAAAGVGIGALIYFCKCVMF